MATAKGGRRPGAGRPAKPVKYAGAINAAERKIKDRLPEIIDALMVLALGHKISTPEGVVYTTAPDRASAQYLANRIMGSPIQRQEIEGSIDTIRIIYDDPEPGETDQDQDQDDEAI